MPESFFEPSQKDQREDTQAQGRQPSAECRLSGNARGGSGIVPSGSTHQPEDIHAPVGATNVL